MTLAVLFSLIAYSLTALCSIFIIRRRISTRRLRMLMVVVGLLPLVQCLTLLRNKAIWLTSTLNTISDMTDLIVGALCLYAIYLIDVESRDRKRTDMQLRLVESETIPATKPHPPQWLAQRTSP
jgi:amino acid transporter